MPIFQGNRALLEAFRRGEAEALTQVFHRFVDDVGRLVRLGFRDGALSVSGVRNPAREEELVQDVFLRAFAVNARNAYDGLSPYAPYLMRIAKNLLIDEARSQHRLVPIEATQLAELVERGITDDSRSVEEELEWAPLREATRAFRASLDPSTAEFLRLRFEEGQSQAEVGTALGLTRRRIRTLEDQLRNQLAAFLEARRLR